MKKLRVIIKPADYWWYSKATGEVINVIQKDYLEHSYWLIEPSLSYVRKKYNKGAETILRKDCEIIPEQKQLELFE